MMDIWTHTDKSGNTTRITEWFSTLCVSMGEYSNPDEDAPSVQVRTTFLDRVAIMALRDALEDWLHTQSDTPPAKEVPFTESDEIWSALSGVAREIADLRQSYHQVEITLARADAIKNQGEHACLCGHPWFEHGWRSCQHTFDDGTGEIVHCGCDRPHG